MPNYCNYGMKIKGSKENVEELIKYLKADYDYSDNLSYCSEKHHFYRIFECGVSEDTIEYIDDVYSCEAYGYCAWSVYSCMFDGDCTYYDSNKKKEDANKYKAITILEASKKLNLEIEIYSEESGCGFMEHFLIRNGELEIEDCVDWTEEYDEETDEHYSEGGLEWVFSI